MAIEVAIIVADAPPLITLAAAQSLEYLLYPALPVIIPDAVFHEATSAAGKLGAQEILDWYRANTAHVRVEPTDTFREEILLREAIPGRKPARDLGERAAIEVIRNYPMGDEARALLLSDDRDAERLLVFEPEKMILLTTWDYLRQLEMAKRIQSADAVTNEAAAANALSAGSIYNCSKSQQTFESRHDPLKPPHAAIHSPPPNSAPPATT
jgi:hypothetical protein